MAHWRHTFDVGVQPLVRFNFHISYLVSYYPRHSPQTQEKNRFLAGVYMENPWLKIRANLCLRWRVFVAKKCC
jgi:hypothetical protein